MGGRVPQVNVPGRRKRLTALVASTASKLSALHDNLKTQVSLNNLGRVPRIYLL